MTRKSKRAGGNFPLTHYERTKKFASSEYGTTSRRLAGHTQYQLGECALSLTAIDGSNDDAVALCSKSGYLYSKAAILEYMLTQTHKMKQQKDEEEKETQRIHVKELEIKTEEKQRVLDQFKKTQSVLNKNDTKTQDLTHSKQGELMHASFWLPTAQPSKEMSLATVNPIAGNDALVVHKAAPAPERPLSPHSQEPLRRSELWPVQLIWQQSPSSSDSKRRLVCAVSEKVINQQESVAYWTSSNPHKKQSEPGVVILQSIYDTLVIDDECCPLTGKKIKHTRKLQQGGSSFATTTQNAVVKQYRPTIT